MELDDGFDDDEPVARWLPPDDRLWRHPSEVATNPWPPVAMSRAREPRLWTVALLAGVIGSLLTTGLIAAGGGFRNRRNAPLRSVERVVTGTSVNVRAAAPAGSVVEIAERVRPAIVQIKVDSGDGPGSGSGVLFRNDGHVLTNNHVIEGADSIIVVLADGKEHKAKLIGGDADTDVAVVKVDTGSFPTAVLGTAAGLKVGLQAIAVGSPLGLAGGPSVSVGVISALGREVEGSGKPLLDMIQTDAPIAPGSSGGALLDGGGSVIGITTAIAVSDVGAEGLGFATPIDIARDVAEQLISTGKVVHVWMGIEGEDLDTARAKQLGVDAGAVVRRVRASSPAAKAGIKAGDVITSIDKKPVASMPALQVALRSRKPGQVITVELVRDTKPESVSVTLSERPKNL